MFRLLGIRVLGFWGLGLRNLDLCGNILAGGGSKGVPNFNPKIKGTFLGNPIINKDYSILASILGCLDFGEVPYVDNHPHSPPTFPWCPSLSGIRVCHPAP